MTDALTAKLVFYATVRNVYVIVRYSHAIVRFLMWRCSLCPVGSLPVLRITSQGNCASASWYVLLSQLGVDIGVDLGMAAMSKYIRIYGQVLHGMRF